MADPKYPELGLQGGEKEPPNTKKLIKHEILPWQPILCWPRDKRLHNWKGKRNFIWKARSYCLFGFAGVCFLSDGRSLLKVNYPFCWASGVKTTPPLRCTCEAFRELLGLLELFQVLRGNAWGYLRCKNLCGTEYSSCFWYWNSPDST